MYECLPAFVCMQYLWRPEVSDPLEQELSGCEPLELLGTELGSSSAAAAAVFLTAEPGLYPGLSSSVGCSGAVMPMS